MRSSFRALAKVQASQLMSTVEVQKPPERIDAALAESLRLARAKEETLAVLLAKKSLTPEEVQALQATVAAYRERLTDIAKHSIGSSGRRSPRSVNRSSRSIRLSSTSSSSSSRPRRSCRIPGGSPPAAAASSRSSRG
jgi:hypothetical protein